MPAGEDLPDPEAVQMILPAHIREDPRPGKSGGSPTFGSCIAIWDSYIGQIAEGRPGCRMWGWSKCGGLL